MTRNKKGQKGHLVIHYFLDLPEDRRQKEKNNDLTRTNGYLGVCCMMRRSAVAERGKSQNQSREEKLLDMSSPLPSTIRTISSVIAK